MYSQLLPKNIEKKSDTFNEVYFKKIEKVLLPHLSNRLLNYSIIFNKKNDVIVTQSNNKDIGKKKFFNPTSSQRSYTEHAEIRALKYYLMRRCKNKELMLFSLRAKICNNFTSSSDFLEKINIHIGTPCINCFKILSELYKIKNIFFTIDDKKIFYKFSENGKFLTNLKYSKNDKIKKE